MLQSSLQLLGRSCARYLRLRPGPNDTFQTVQAETETVMILRYIQYDGPRPDEEFLQALRKSFSILVRVSGPRRSVSKWKRGPTPCGARRSQSPQLRAQSSKSSKPGIQSFASLRCMACSSRARPASQEAVCRILGVAWQVTVYWENGKENEHYYNYGVYTVVCMSDKYLSGPAASERRAGGAGAAGRRGPLFFAFVRCFQVRCFPKLGGTLVLGLPYIRVTVSGSILGSPYVFGKVRFAF